MQLHSLGVAVRVIRRGSHLNETCKSRQLGRASRFIGAGQKLISVAACKFVQTERARARIAMQRHSLAMADQPQGRLPRLR